MKIVIITRKETFATLTLNRPEKQNAVDPEMAIAIVEAVEDVAKDKTVRAVIITGAGKSFSAGGDVETSVGAAQKMSVSEWNEYYGQANRAYTIIHEMEKPVIAAINGYAVGGGMELALCCDIRIAAEDAKMAEFFVRMGVCPEVGQYMLPRLVGLGTAKLISMLGDFVSAKDAERIGLVERVVPADKLMTSAEELASRLANGPKAIGVIKKAINASLTMSWAQSIDYTSCLMHQLLQSEDSREAVKAYMEKRKPEFRGK